ncbi:hypothetical protein B0A50_06862 [Salinomyces thailandicus]|uniref:Uncharacterized protein n=1 Tax=Salinomyces thailandicus TaxID=706561 RepID=A0A4U0TQK5_9PEZI|nr:hypothetical protein B0A50_06862 [Salinomyces thailandica]
MKLSITVLLVALFAVLGMAASSEKQVIISYPKGTPTSVMEEAMAEVRKAGGVIEHEYSLIMGFVAKGPAAIFDTVQTMGASNDVLVEEDSEVHAIDS